MQLAEDLFDPVARDGLVDFFTVALHRDATKRFRTLRGIGSVPRYELVRLSREWRQRFSLTEAGLPRADVQWAEGRKPASVRDKKALDSERTGLTSGPKPPLETPEDVARLPVDTIVQFLVPDEPEAEVTAHLDRLRNRWQKSVKPLTSVREDLVEILEAHGRVLGSRQLAAGLLAKRGAVIENPAERLRLAAICVRAAVETEERRESARPPVKRRRSGAPAPGIRQGSTCRLIRLIE